MYNIIIRQIYTDVSRSPNTQVLQGDLDTTGEIFERTLALIIGNETENIYKKFNPKENIFGSHIKQVKFIDENLFRKLKGLREKTRTVKFLCAAQAINCKNLVN